MSLEPERRCVRCGAILAAWERDGCGCVVAARPQTTREAVYAVACASAEPLHARDFARHAAEDHGLHVKANAATTVLATDPRFCWGGPGIYGLYRHGLIPGPRSLEQAARVVLVAAGHSLPHELLDYCLKQMGYRFNSASLRNAVAQSPHVVRDRDGAWDHRRSDEAERELRSQIRLVPERQRAAWIALRDAVDVRIRTVIAKREALVWTVTDRARFGMNWET